MAHKVSIPSQKTLKIGPHLKVVAKILIPLQGGSLDLIIPNELLDHDNIRKGVQKGLGVISHDLGGIICPEPQLSLEEVLSQQVRLDGYEVSLRVCLVQVCQVQVDRELGWVSAQIVG